MPQTISSGRELSRRVVVFRFVNGAPPNIAARFFPISAMLVWEKSTHPIRTKNMVMRFRTTKGRRSSFGMICFSIASSTKKYSPQRTKFQLAPCQRPVSAQTTSRFRICRPLPFRLPPSGI